MAMNMRIRDLQEGDLVEVDDAPARVSCALVLDHEVIIVLDDDRGRQLTLSGSGEAVRLLSRG